MLYDQSKTKQLSDELFKNPTSEYRGAPFWSWNDVLDEAECVRQAGIFREMGFGGYHMHPRMGLATPYLGEKFNSCVKACVQDAKEKGMLAWLYDEDRYPSGFAGGVVTKDGRFRRRGLFFTTKKRAEDATYLSGRQAGGARLLATYALRFRLGKCVGYKRLKAGERCPGKIFYAYLVVDEPTDGFNQCGYVDTLSKEALDAFAEYTYGTYQSIVGEEFGKTIPAIFTDEPQMKFASPFKNSHFAKEAILPWTDDLAEGYEKTFGVDLLDKLPELFFDLDSPTLYRTRYTYHIYRTERFAQAFSDNLGKRAAALGIHLTGHLMEEPALGTQCVAVGETMRHYKHFGLPGIDMLCGRHEYTTAKQTESVVRQEGREGMLCELYGVSRWAVEFGKFKEEGDWLACLGVTARVPHLSFYSMKGEGKRDYPPSIFYQSPWYLKFKALEDHFARLNTALTRGRVVNEVAVIHPIESYFLHFAAKNTSRKYCKEMEKNFFSLTDRLLFGGYDFDFLSEALLPSQRREDPLAVGECRYKTVILPGLLTMRRSTLDYLRAFRAAGGNVVFLGEAPRMIEGEISDEAADFAKLCECIPFTRESVLSAVEENQKVKLLSEKRENEYLTTLREDGEGRWLFLTAPRAGFPYPHSVPVKNDRKVVKDRVKVGLKGVWQVTEYDTMTGEIRPLPVSVEEGVSYVTKVLYNHDSLLLRFEEKAASAVPQGEKKERDILRILPPMKEARYTLDEPNVLLLDKAAWSIGEGFESRIDLDIATARARKKLGMPPYRNNLQPWIHGEGGEKKEVTLRFRFDSELALPAHLACEYERFTLRVNGERVDTASDGYYVDRVFRTTPIMVKKGRNVIDFKVPIGEYDCLENCYLLGDFGVEIKRNGAKLVPLPERLSFRDVTKQKMPFYSGKITYHTTFETKGEDVAFAARYASALLSVRVNDREEDILFAPYAAVFPTKEGENTLDITAYVSRQNAFGPVHIRKKYKRSDSPSWYHKTSRIFRVRRYVLDEGGLLTPPTISLLKKG